MADRCPVLTPPRPRPAAPPAGLLRVVRTRCATHSDTDERKLAQAVLRKWQPPEGGSGDGSRPGSAQASQASGAPRPPSRLQQAAGAVQAQAQKGSQPDLAAYLDEQTARRLEELQQKAAAAAAESERLRREAEEKAAAEMQQPGPSGSSGAAEPRITSFEVGVAWSGCDTAAVWQGMRRARGSACKSRAALAAAARSGASRLAHRVLHPLALTWMSPAALRMPSRCRPLYLCHAGLQEAAGRRQAQAADQA